ncbi:lysosomal acid glucosylceramidase-like [Euwallacea similis]|uniref:lysosomal acid glucosylceramidase-like n=1 Tax=Euwallacea similis TaxID=1736056 RepID=UPI00344D066B
MIRIHLKTILVSLLSLSVSSEIPCNVLTTNSGSVCVCTSSYCDSVPKVIDLQPGQYQFYTTSKEKLGFWSVEGRFDDVSISGNNTIRIANISTTYQTILGFGGAFTDATGINILRLSENTQELLMQSYFGEDGIEYSLGRIPFGGTDFSTREYTYCDVEDDTLESFALQEEDFNYKIPFVQKALELRGGSDNFKFIASAWSAPAWMKSNNKVNGFSFLLDDYYNLWAKYYLKSLDAYKENNIEFWGITTQNEPNDGYLMTKVPNNGFSFFKMRKWITNFFGPAIRNSTYTALKIIAHDDQLLFLPITKYIILEDEDAVSYVDGIGLHWYTNFFIKDWFHLLASSSKKELFRLATEACIDTLTNSGLTVDMGSWDRAEEYLDDIITDLKYDFIGWIDWNMALSETGGPNWVENETDAPIIVNGDDDEFYKQPMFYALGHFSKFIVPGSVRIAIENSLATLKTVAFVRPDGKIAVILWNRSSLDVSIMLDILGDTKDFTIKGHSINTLLYLHHNSE